MQPISLWEKRKYWNFLNRWIEVNFLCITSYNKRFALIHDKSLQNYYQAKTTFGKMLKAEYLQFLTFYRNSVGSMYVFSGAGFVYWWWCRGCHWLVKHDQSFPGSSFQSWHFCRVISKNANLLFMSSPCCWPVIFLDWTSFNDRDSW